MESKGKRKMSNNSTAYEVDDDIWMVPCKIDDISKKFIPVCRPDLNDGANAQRQSWSEREDEVLMELVHARGTKKWTAISKELNDIMYNGRKIRHGKQCRERWGNHLNPSLKKGGWTADEDMYILKRHQEIGSKWSQIAKELQGRTENSVKNRWKSIIRKGEKAGLEASELLGTIRIESGGETGEGNGFYSEENNFTNGEEGRRNSFSSYDSNEFNDIDSPSNFLVDF
ncbi:unnamed protein product [Blepharisma stoltei]|uniref:Uncharacterized protein n=1 Tax=Blepharisma stoltei TaxID=1481888 RepID=A0AAU9ILZ7_9CILI|nr:unnamed protein product [Blepharisma stoltei]